jgi:hypothetical protein
MNPPMMMDGQLVLFDLPTPPTESRERSSRDKRRRVAKPPRAQVVDQLALFEELLAKPEHEIDVEAWTTDDVVSLREFMLWRHVHYVMDRRTSDETIRETWEWILSEDVAPFSFRVCLDSVMRQTGNTLPGNDSVMTCDPDEIREQIYGYAQRYGTWHGFSLLTHHP